MTDISYIKNVACRYYGVGFKYFTCTQVILFGKFFYYKGDNSTRRSIEFNVLQGVKNFSINLFIVEKSECYATNITNFNKFRHKYFYDLS